MAGDYRFNHHDVTTTAVLLSSTTATRNRLYDALLRWFSHVIDYNGLQTRGY